MSIPAEPSLFQYEVQVFNADVNVCANIENPDQTSPKGHGLHCFKAILQKILWQEKHYCPVSNMEEFREMAAMSEIQTKYGKSVNKTEVGTV